MNNNTNNESLHLKYRPRSLDKVVGNETTVAALKAMLAKGTLPHTILLSGPRGSGKTTIARILKDELECSDMDWHEINSSSDRGIDGIRRIASDLHNHPAAGPVKIYFFDECHNILPLPQETALKMWEEPPKHVYFFLATTDPEDLIPTVRDRCNPMPVRALTFKELERLCDYVCGKEGIELSDKVKDDLVASADGSARMLLVLLDKIRHLDESQQAEAIAQKLAEENEAIDLCRALIEKKTWKDVAKILQNLKGEPEKTRWAVLGYARSVLLRQGTYQAYLVIDAFARPFFDSKAAGLAMACFEAIQAKG